MYSPLFALTLVSVVCLVQSQADVAVDEAKNQLLNLFGGGGGGLTGGLFGGGGGVDAGSAGHTGPGMGGDVGGMDGDAGAGGMGGDTGGMGGDAGGMDVGTGGLDAAGGVDQAVDVLLPGGATTADNQSQPSAGSTAPTKLFSLADIQRMIDGIASGLSFDLNGQVTTATEGLITLQYLNEQKALLTGDSTSNVMTLNFTLGQIEQMLKGMNDGRLYNIHGQDAQPGEQIITRNMLESQLPADRVAALGNTVIIHNTQSVPSSTNAKTVSTHFTPEKIRSMIHGMQRGLRFNYEGELDMNGMNTLTLDDLNEMLSKKELGGTK
ncbi:hypothetical protein ACF0H5_018182 [Mactra antiquata]